MKLSILWVGKSREAWIKEAILDYSSRIRRYCSFDMIEVREEKGAEAEESRRRECERIKGRLPSGTTLILLDEHGEQMTSVELASFIGKQRDNGAGNMVFAIGGAYGFSEEFRRGTKQLSLSKMTFTHQMVRVFTLEQIYRAFTILNNEQYHHQ
ncbi:MAG: ribosomal RNA large subunit methyltransferase H [Geobacteraceae bacterium GWC2_48_7]|nr:MAG: ribosomal RNA large subunit methyltransferase H [Geobacteraceae bacterium GWC2_48_7]